MQTFVEKRTGRKVKIGVSNRELKPVWAFVEIGLTAILGAGLKLAVIADPNDRREYLYYEVSASLGIGGKLAVGAEVLPKPIDEFKSFSIDFSANASFTIKLPFIFV